MRSASEAFEPATHVPLAPLTTLKVGGDARWFGRATTPEHVAEANTWCAERNVDLFVMGGGSNVVFGDKGYPGLVLQMALRGIESWKERDDTLVRAGAGEEWDDVVSWSVSRGLVGLECLSGIPGSVGGTPIQNVGAYGQDVSAVIDEVTTFDRRSASVVSMTGVECGFSYRMSRFKRRDADRFVVCHVTFRLRAGRPTVTYQDVSAMLTEAGIATPGVADVRSAVLEVRRRKGMVLDPTDPDTCSVGSFFTNPSVPADVYERIAAVQPGGGVPSFAHSDGARKIPAAWLIERAGFSKGYVLGRVGLSTKHPLAIINRGSATAGEVLALAARIKRQVADRFGIILVPEPVFAGLENNPDANFLRAAHP